MLSITKLQNLKAIHNRATRQKWHWNVVINRKTTKFESNSQLAGSAVRFVVGCYQSQNYKIWKQFTTTFLVVILRLIVVINHKTTKFESNSQRLARGVVILLCCYQSQNYKIWKQFTTHHRLSILLLLLLSITKLQNLKAIHNQAWCFHRWQPVVINHKTTKFESNSQPVCLPEVFKGCCYQSQNYKIWKQFTTYQCGMMSLIGLLSITKLQNLKAIHNWYRYNHSIGTVVINHKTTKFESNSQQPTCKR